MKVYRKIQLASHNIVEYTNLEMTYKDRKFFKKHLSPCGHLTTANAAELIVIAL